MALGIRDTSNVKSDDSRSRSWWKSVGSGSSTCKTSHDTVIKNSSLAPALALSQMISIDRSDILGDMPSDDSKGPQCQERGRTREYQSHRRRY